MAIKTSKPFRAARRRGKQILKASQTEQQKFFANPLRGSALVRNPLTGRMEFKVLPFGESLMSASRQLGELIANPGGLGGNVSAAIAPRLAMESEQIAANMRGQLSEAQGAQARSGLGGGSFSQALEAAIQNAGAREQADARRTALSQSEQLRRADLDVARQIMEFLSSQRLQKRSIKQGQGALNLQEEQASKQSQAANLATIGSLIAAFA